MLNSTKCVLEKICFHVFKDCSLVYFITDNLGRVFQWGGNLVNLKMPIPELESHISDVVLFMEGILPLKESSMEFSCIKMPFNVCVDAFLFEVDKGYGLIVWDATQKEDYLTQTQQKCNELSLLIEQQKNFGVHCRGNRTTNKNKLFIEEVFQALDFLVLEMNDKGHFAIIGAPPPWIKQIPNSSQMFLGLGYEKDELSFLGNFIQEAKSQWSKKHRHILKSGVWSEEDHSGQELLFEATAIDIHGQKLLIITQDICFPNEKQSLIQKGRNLALHFHELKRSDRKLKHKHDELELRVKERTKDLEQVNMELANELKERKKAEKDREEVFQQLRQSQKMEAIGTLAGGIAHDFNNILAAIMGFTELSLYEAEEGSALKSMLEKTLHASNRAKELVSQILTFSHQTEYEKRPLKLKLIILEVIDLLRASLPASINIEKNLQSTSYILADQTQMHQVIMNLCTNAGHAMKESGGILSVDLKEVDIKQEDLDNPKLSPGRYLVLTIKDTGCGIGPDVVERIFDPYFTTKEKDKGTGLGLSVVHGIVINSNGHITVNSQLGKGSEFVIYFPLFNAQDKPTTVKKSIPIGDNERILFVDDESFQTELAQQLLTLLGYQVVTCNDSLSALNLFLDEKDSFDLVITDMIMPKMTGKILAEKILKIRPDMPIIICSGYSEDIDSNSINKMGIYQYLMKPIGIQEMAKAVKKVLKKNRGRTG